MKAACCAFSCFLALFAAAAPAAEGADAATRTAGERLKLGAGVGPLTGAAVLDIETLAPVSAQQPGIRLLAAVQPGELVSAFYPFSYRHISRVGDVDLLPRGGSRQIQEAGQQWFIAFTYRHQDAAVELSRSAGGEPYGQDTITANTHDLLTALFHLRDLDPAKTAQFTVYENRRLYRITAAAAKKETVQVEAGTFPAWHRALQVDPTGEQLTEPDLHLWISRDRHRLPLRLTASTVMGQLELQLLEWSAPDKD
jgi:hypothetical protein